MDFYLSVELLFILIYKTWAFKPDFKSLSPPSNCMFLFFREMLESGDGQGRP